MQSMRLSRRHPIQKGGYASGGVGMEGLPVKEFISLCTVSKRAKHVLGLHQPTR